MADIIIWFNIWFAIPGLMVWGLFELLKVIWYGRK